MIGDKAYDSDTLDHDLAERYSYSIEMIAPHRGQRRGTHTGWPSVAALPQGVGEWNDSLPGCITFVRLVIRWEYHVENFFGMVRLGCMQILLRHL